MFTKIFFCHIYSIFTCNVSVVQTNVKVDRDNLILVFSRGSLHAISGIDGEVVWKKDFAAERYNRFGVETVCFPHVRSILTSYAIFSLMFM